MIRPLTVQAAAAPPRRRLPAAGRATTEAALLIQHQHKPEEFDPGHCRTCAGQARLLDHYDRVQQEEARLRQALRWAHAARRYAAGRWAYRAAAASCWPRLPS